MGVEKWWNGICGRVKREKPREKPTQTPFRPPRNPHGVTETRTWDPSGWRRAPNRLRHEAALIYLIQTRQMLVTVKVSILLRYHVDLISLYDDVLHHHSIYLLKS